MDTFPFIYVRVAPSTWAYLSSLLMLALFFKFNRFWSVRNLDLCLIILLAPGLLLIEGGRQWVAQNSSVVESARESASNLAEPIEKAMPPAGLQASVNSESTAGGDNPIPMEEGLLSPKDEEENSATPTTDEKIAGGKELNLDSKGIVWQRLGYYWLFSIGGILLIRMLIDPGLTRRPQLEPNLAIGGMVFFGFSLMMFLFANIAISEPTNEDLSGSRNAVKLLQRKAVDAEGEEQLKRRGPGYTLFNLFPIIPSFESGDAILKTNPDTQKLTDMSRYIIAAKSLAIASQVLIVLGLVLFCYFNYDNFKVGVGISTIYLMLPYTSIYTGHVLHVLPAALILWAILSFRRPWIAGILFGLATSVSYYPIFLLPLWISFFWDRGRWRFIVGALIAILICIGVLLFTSANLMSFWGQLQVMFGFWSPRMDGLQGIWALGWSNWWRLPLLVAFVLFCVSFAAWPSQKNIGTLVGYSAAVMLAVQYWHGFSGGVYMAWYLPMVLLIFFRPNLDGRTAQMEVGGIRRRQKETAEDLLPSS